MSEYTHTALEQLPLNTGVHRLAHNEDGLVALEKPAGVLSHPNRSEENKRSLLLADYDLEQECYHWTNDAGEKCNVWLINRLDSPTSGVILLGLNPEISRVVKDEFARHRVSKVYKALVKGKPSQRSGLWADQLNKNVHRGSRSTKKTQVIPSEARYETIESSTGSFPVTLIKLMPLTGRTHQLRIQCQKHGLPIVGDRNYGSFSFNKEVAMRAETKRMMLHSAETTVRYQFKGVPREFTAKSQLPEDFEILMAYQSGSKKPSKPGKRAVLAGRRFKA